MKKFAISILSIFFTFSTVSIAMASPGNANKAENNPHVVAYYSNQTDVHAIPTDPVTYVIGGTDLVMTRGNTGEIQAWYTAADGHGIHSIWNISKNGTCPNGWVLIKNAYPNWGTYLTPGADYCVNNNSF